VKKQKRTILISDEIDLQLRLRAASARKPVSRLIEEAVEQYFKPQESLTDQKEVA